MDYEDFGPKDSRQRNNNINTVLKDCVRLGVVSWGE